MFLREQKNIPPKMNRIIRANVRNELLLRKTCANVPGNFAPGCKGYICPMWKCNGGYFDEAGCQIDHIIEVTHGGNSNIKNLQVLCPSCHAVKTKRCAEQKWLFTSDDIDIGRSHMEIEQRSGAAHRDAFKRKRSNSN